jgi:hypothetical protein
MPADQPRTRTAGCKMTDNEYERLAAVAEGDGMTLGEWVREVLLERADGRKPSVIEEALLGEVLALHGGEGRENHGGRDAGDHRPGRRRESEEGGGAPGSEPVPETNSVRESRL